VKGHGSRVKVDRWQLTSVAVSACPAVDTDALAVRRAAVVSAVVVARPAELGTSRSVVVARTDDPVVEL